MSQIQQLHRLQQEFFSYWKPGMSAHELKAASRRAREAKEQNWKNFERQAHALMEETARLTASRTDIPRRTVGKPRLERARAKLRLIESKSKPAVAPAPKSRTPRLDKYRALIHAMQERLRALESSIARPQRQAGEPIDIDVRWSRAIP